MLYFGRIIGYPDSLTLCMLGQNLENAASDF
jgi:hypothetical protein